MGYASTALGDEASVIFSNAAGLGFLNRIRFQTNLSRLFDLDELSEKEFCLVYPFRSFSLGIGTFIFGKADYYQETVLTFALGYSLKDYLSFGSSFKYMRVAFSPTYRALSALGIDLGAIGKFDDKVQLGAVVKNLNQPKLLDDSDDIPTIFSSGMAVFPFEEVTLTFDFSYDKRNRGQLHFGQEVELIKNLPLRFGIQTSPARYTLGVGFCFRKMNIDYAYLNHSVLNGSHKLSFSFSWGNETAR